MDLIEKLETLLSAAARAKLPRRGRRSVLDEAEEKILAEIRQALAQVEAQEQLLAERLKQEQDQAQAAAEREDREQQRTHERRALELERQLEQESVQAINLEEKLNALEQKLALAKAAVEKEAKAAALRDEAATQAMAQSGRAVEQGPESRRSPGDEPMTPANLAGDDADTAGRKDRLAGLSE